MTAMLKTSKVLTFTINLGAKIKKFQLLNSLLHKYLNCSLFQKYHINQVLVFLGQSSIQLPFKVSFSSFMSSMITPHPSFPFLYFFYGSEDSLDQDVIISIPRNYMPSVQEDRKVLLKQLEIDYSLTWNAIFAVIEDGYVVDTIYPKSWIDTLNNSLYETYPLHQQIFANPIKSKMRRNKLLAIYKAVRTVLTMVTRTHLRTIVRPIINGIHPFELKIKALKQIDWFDIEFFNQKNTQDINIWKTIAFYIGQNILLIEKDLEIYTKKNLLKELPLLENFIYRKELSLNDKAILQEYTQKWIDIVENYGTYHFIDGKLSCKDEVVDTKNEIFL